MRLIGYSLLLSAVVLSVVALPLTAAVGVGDKAPDFSLPSVDGKSTVRLSDCTSKPTLLVFWTAICPHCRAEAPVIQRLFVDLHGKGLNVVGVGLGERSAISDFVAKYKFTFPAAFGAGDKGQAVITAYGLRYVPMLLVIGTDGKVKAAWSGEIEEKTIRSAIAEQGIK